MPDFWLLPFSEHGFCAYQVKPNTLSKSMAIAEDLRKLCATTPGMNSYQPIAASAVEVWSATASNGEKIKTRKTDKLAAYRGPDGGFDRQDEECANISAGLNRTSRKLEAIRRHIYQMPNNKTKLFLGYNKYKRETTRLKAELEKHLYELPVICDAPVLNFLKPAVGIVALICDTAKCVRSNHDAAIDLAQHASTVTKLIVDRVSAMDSPSAADNEDALEALKCALEDIQVYLTFLGKPRRRLAPWVFANQEKDRVVHLNGALDKALAMFLAMKILSTVEDVRSSAGQIGVLVSTVQRLDSDVNRTLTIMHADLHKLSGAAANEGFKTRDDGSYWDPTYLNSEDTCLGRRDNPISRKLPGTWVLGAEDEPNATWMFGNMPIYSSPAQAVNQREPNDLLHRPQITGIPPSTTDVILSRRYWKRNADIELRKKRTIHKYEKFSSMEVGLSPSGKSANKAKPITRQSSKGSANYRLDSQTSR
ncbi:hypothetical protein FB451DRAFT_1162841 [Mycena latifolia]|nr:hypothetical protein FB451DRAFT_1162841 [Mycena latifolia]